MLWSHLPLGILGRNYYYLPPNLPNRVTILGIHHIT